jgi:D-alanyl-D-alanine carboxypeptidase
MGSCRGDGGSCECTRAVLTSNGARLRSVSVVLALLAFAVIARAGISHEMTRHINQDVKTVLQRTETPGATILVIRDGQALYRKAIGLRDLDRRFPVRMDTHYEIASITKQFTAAAILQLRDAGKLNIDEKVSAYLPDVPHADEVTLRQLLTHTSGIPDYFGLKSDEEFTRPTTFAELMKLADKPLDFAPGSRASYSNTGYMILGRIIEVTSHESYHQYRLEHLLKPAGMTQTYIVPDESSLATMASGYRRVNGKREPGLTIHDSYSWSAGDLVSTVGDVEKWNEALASGKVVPYADYVLMMSPQITAEGGNTGYGFGLFIDKVNDQPRIGHTGGSFGFSAANFYFPQQKLRIIVLTNNVDAPEPGEIISNAIFNDLYPDLASEAMRPAPDEDLNVTSKAKAAFAALERGEGDGSVFSASLEAKMKAGLAQRMARQFASYGDVTAFVFKGRQVVDGKRWFDYVIEFGPGSTFNFSAAMDDEGKVASLAFNRF